MKFKTLRRIDTKEFGYYLDEGFMYTSDRPQLLSVETTMELYKSTINLRYPKDIDNYELIEIEVLDSGEIGADIRNKLSPLKNLIALLKERDKYTFDSELYVKLSFLIENEMEQCEKCIDNLANLL